MSPHDASGSGIPRGLAWAVGWNGVAVRARGEGAVEAPKACPLRASRLLLCRQVRHQGRIVRGTRRDLDHGDAHLGREELFRIGPFVSMATATAIILDHQMHFLDSLRP